MKVLNFPYPQTSSVEIERVCDRADESVLETAAVSVAPPDGGPELLMIFVVQKKGFDQQPEKLKTIFSKAIQTNLNPLFKVWLLDVLISIHMSRHVVSAAKHQHIIQCECLSQKSKLKSHFNYIKKSD